jgi:hypothetical protein
MNDIIKKLVKTSKCPNGYFKFNGNLEKYYTENGNIKTSSHLIEYDKTFSFINYPFLHLEISKVIHDFKNLLNPLYGFLQNEDGSSEFFKEFSEYYLSDFEKVISSYESVREKFYDQEADLLTILDLYLQNFIILDQDVNNFKINLGDISHKINNLYLCDSNFIVIVKRNKIGEIELDKKPIDSLLYTLEDSKC